MSHSLHNEIHLITDTEEHARDFLFQRGILKSSMSCPGCSSTMNLVSCSSKKSSDLLIWRCSPCSRFRNIRTDSVLSEQKLTFSLFLQLVFYLSIKSLANVAISQLTGVSENTVSDWKTLIHTRVADFLVSNPSPLGGPGVVVEMDEAKFGKRKYNKGAYREGQWVLGAVDRSNGNCFLLPCPNNSRDAATLLPLIQRWILPGSVVYKLTSGEPITAWLPLPTLITPSTTRSSSWTRQLVFILTLRKDFGLTWKSLLLEKLTWN